MKVYACFEIHFNEADQWENLVKVFDDEIKALMWKEEIVPTRWDFREYREYEVE